MTSARPPHHRPVDRRPAGAQDGGLLRPVPPLGLEEDHRVRALDRLPQQPVRVGRGGRGDDPQARRVSVVRLGGVAVVLDAADPAAVRDPHHDRQRQRAAGPVVQLGQVAGDLLEGRVGEGVELHLDHRPRPYIAMPMAVPTMPGLGQRGVEHPGLAEACRQPVGDPEDAAERADVLAEDDHPLVGGQASPSARFSAPAMVTGAAGGSGPTLSAAAVSGTSIMRGSRRRPSSARPATGSPAAASAAVGSAYTCANRSAGSTLTSAFIRSRTSAASCSASAAAARRPRRRAAPAAAGRPPGGRAGRGPARLADLVADRGSGWRRRRWCAPPSGR